MLLPPALVMLLRARYLFALGSQLQSAYLNAASYIIVLYGTFTSVYVLVWQLSNIFLQRSQNRRFEEVMKIKTDVSNLLVNYCRPPARQITALSRLFYALSKDGVLPARFHRINRHGALCSGPAVMNLSLFSQAAIMTAASSSWQRCTTNPSKTSAPPKRWCPAGWRNTRLKRRPTSIRFLNRRTQKCIRKNNC